MTTPDLMADLRASLERRTRTAADRARDLLDAAEERGQRPPNMTTRRDILSTVEVFTPEHLRELLRERDELHKLARAVVDSPTIAAALNNIDALRVALDGDPIDNLRKALA
jgi:hypothetical protein